MFLVHVSDVEMQAHYDGFFEEVFVELESKVCCDILLTEMQC